MIIKMRRNRPAHFWHFMMGEFLPLSPEKNQIKSFFTTQEEDGTPFSTNFTKNSKQIKQK